MAFNFYGTFTTGQLSAFREFSKLQEQDLVKRLSMITMELKRIGQFNTVYDDFQNPVSYEIIPYDSYAAKLMLVYKIMGGVPEDTMLLRTRDIPVYRLPSPEFTNAEDDISSDSGQYSDGRHERGTFRFDRDIGIQVDRAKKWQLESIKRKREEIEHKIRKALDHSDQLQMEHEMITAMIKNPGASFDDIMAEILTLMSRPGSMNTVADSTDKFGTRIGKPVDPSVPTDVESASASGGRVMGGA